MICVESDVGVEEMHGRDKMTSSKFVQNCVHRKNENGRFCRSLYGLYMNVLK